MGRFFRHVLSLPGAVGRAFPASSLSRIEQAVAESENLHGGQIRFAVEAALEPAELLRGVSARERAIEVFSELRVWDTEANNGVLLYLLLADHDVEIVADRGYNGKVRPDEWEAVCREMEASLRGGRYEEAVLEGIRGIAELVAPHFPAGSGRGELSDRPAVV
ncbi:MAG TPA: TPM domain-containing protein [Burkholderiales bacterium]|nr:TPM domain-containing protein [Burkholderiales bacterium]